MGYICDFRHDDPVPNYVEWKTLTDCRRRLLDKAIAYYFDHGDELRANPPPDAVDFWWIEALEERFKIDLNFLRERLAEVYTDFYATGALPFAPDLAVESDDLGMFLMATAELLRYRYSRVGASPDPHVPDETAHTRDGDRG